MCPAAGSKSGLILRLLGRGKSRRWTRELLGKKSNAIRWGPGRVKPGAGATGASRALGLRAERQVWGGQEIDAAGPGARGSVRARRDEQGLGSGDHFAFSIPQGKKKMKLEGGGENSHPHFLLWLPRERLGPRLQEEGRGTR